MRPARSVPPLALLLVLAATAAPASGPYHVATRWKVGGEGGWDDVTADAAARRLYLTHGTKVEVLDLDRGTVIGAVEPTPGAHAVALAPELNRGFVSCGRDSSVVVFDLRSRQVLQRVALPARNPDAIVFEPVSARVLAFNGGSSSACALDATTGAIVGTLDLGGRPEFAVADGHGRVYANLEDQSEILEIDARALKVLNRWPLAPGEEPSGLAMDTAHRRLFSACSNRTLVVMDADSGRVVASLPIGAGVDGVVFDAQRGVAVTSNGEGTITVVREDSPAQFRVAETDSTQRGARTIGLDAKTGRIFTPTAAFGPPPAPTAERPHPRGAILPGTFEVLVLEP